MRIPIHACWPKPHDFYFALLLTITAGSILSAAPVITGVVNAASYRDPRLPASSIAPGGIFIVTGSGLGPANIAISPSPFQSTSLSGTSVSVTVGSKTVNALMYYTSATQLAALLPSSTPPAGPDLGNSAAQATITVTYNGEDSGPTSFRGVAVGVGLFTVDSSGYGPVIVTNPDYSLVSAVPGTVCGGPNTACGSANTGDTLTLWATGLGPVPGNDGPGSLGQSLPNLPLKVWVGGVQAPILYQGRSGCCIGLDQIAFTVPDNVPAGCAVPLVVQLGIAVSNSTVIPVANGSRTCTPTDPTVAAANVQQWAAQPSPTLGVVEVETFPNQGQGNTERARFTFVRAAGLAPALLPFLVSYFDQPPAGTCTIVPAHDPTMAGPGFRIQTILSKLGPVPIDAGSHFTFTGPKNTTANITANSGEWVVYSPIGAYIGSTLPGSYTSTGGPGNDVGSFTARLTIPAQPTFTSPASTNGLIVLRRMGMDVAWNPGGATGPIPLILAAAVGTPADPNNVIHVAANCTVLATAGAFTIPSYALLALPSTGGGANLTFHPGDLQPLASGLFSASGLNLGMAQVAIQDVPPPGFSLQ